uniref:Uncharacterized protein n=1 Tax=Coccolithus braarudii TaxID=221442 RepID=A0A7S0LRG5_9EUKA|mmetsp:Transcript_644/g.1256  ORF Transcript_644/g.1256 Transcript_644/m.1256 type:complete len:331 (+) Transcript_644:52-1044(+)
MSILRLGLQRAGLLGRRLVTTPTGLATLGGLGVGSYGMQLKYGNSTDFFQHEFKTTKDPDAIVDFYSTEDFLQILGIFGIAIQFVLAGVQWDTDTENSMTCWNSMQISFDITEREETVDGEEVVALFNKREKFINYVPLIKSVFPILLWDQVQNFGFQRQQDGTIIVRHHGEYFHGPWPVRFLVQLHARYVIWATERHINSPIFGTDDLELQEHQRSNIPLHVFKEFLSSLQVSEEKAIKKAKLAGTTTVHMEASLANLERLKRTESVVSVQRRGSKVKLAINDKEAQEVIRSALEEISRVEGSQATAAALQELLKKSGYEPEEAEKSPA